MDRTDNAITQLAAVVRTHLVPPGSDELLSDFNISLLRVGIPQSVLDTKTYEEAVQAVVQDTSLVSLHPASDGTPVTLAGSLFGVGLSMVNVPACVVGAAAFEVAVTKGTLPEDELIRCTLEHLHKMRQIAAGETIELRVLAGLKGFSLSEGEVCHTPLGSLQAIDSRMQGEQPTWTIWTPHSELPPSVVFITTVPYHIDVVQPHVPQPRSKDTALDDIPQRLLPARLAILLASEPALPLHRPQLAQFTAVLPHGGAFTYTPSGEAPPLAESRSLTRAELDAVNRFATALGVRDVRSIGVAMSRALSAATERRQATDVLIDAVTAWENLVGTEGETSFRVTAALAHLLEPEAEQRSQRHKDLKKIYGVRSRVVHGGQHDEDLVRQNAGSAVSVALDALRTVLIDEAWLLSFHKSQERADAILLGDPRFRAGQSLRTHSGEF